MRNPFNFEPEIVTSQEIMNAEEEVMRRRRSPKMRRRPVRPRPRFPAPSWPFALPYPWPVPPPQPLQTPSGGGWNEPVADSATPSNCPPPANPTDEPAAMPASAATDQEYWPGEDEAFVFEFPGEDEYEIGGGAAPPTVRPLTAAQIRAAAQANQRTARQFGWGHVVRGIVRPSSGTLRILSLTAGATEETLSRAIAQFQQTVMRRPGNGIIDEATFKAMLRNGAFPRLRQRKSWTVRFGGETLGVIEQTAPYVPTGSNQGVEIQFGFRVTNMAAVRRAGFIGAGGENDFRWIQLIELRRISAGAADTRIQQLRRSGRGRIIDPTDALLPVDAHPYYRYETSIVDARFGGHSGPGSGWHVSDEHNAEGRNGLCYDWLFYDRPNIPASAAQPGRRAYFNFETALVGRRRQRNGETCNVLLNTVLWGFDLIQNGTSYQLKLNALQAGRYGGSPELRQWLNRELNRGGFRGHHFLGSGFTGKARCS